MFNNAGERIIMSGTSAYRVRINTHTADSSAMILLVDGVLIGVVTELLDDGHGTDQGKWTIETSFGLEGHPIPATFASANEAADWLCTRISGEAFALSEAVPDLR